MLLITVTISLAETPTPQGKVTTNDMKVIYDNKFKCGEVSAAMSYEITGVANGWIKPEYNVRTHHKKSIGMTEVHFDSLGYSYIYFNSVENCLKFNKIMRDLFKKNIITKPNNPTEAMWEQKILYDATNYLNNKNK